MSFANFSDTPLTKYEALQLAATLIGDKSYEQNINDSVAYLFDLAAWIMEEDRGRIS